MIGTDDNERLALEEELARVESMIQELRQKRLQLKRRINDYSPILKLPPEILVQIFMTAFPENSSSSWDLRTPLLLGVVCHKWRELAFSCPLLWSSVSLIVEHYSNTKNDLLEEWLARSRGLPLSIHLRMEEPQLGDDVIWKKTMDIIARCSEQWWTIDFYLLFIFHHELCFVPTQFPLLVSISIDLSLLSNNYSSLMSKLDGSSRVVWNAPKLQSVYVNPEVAQSLVLPLNQIINFSYTSCSNSRMCLRVLRDTPNLVKCQFEAMEGTSSPLIKATALQLKTLEIGFTHTVSGNTCMSRFLDHLTTPALRNFSISENGICCMSFPSEVFISFMSHSACHLLRLSLSRIFLSSDQLASCLSVTPSLTELELEGIEITRKTFEDLSIVETSQTILLPNLERFIYVQGGSSRHTLDFSRLIMMAASRQHFDPRISASLQRITKLKSICIDFFEASTNLYLDSSDNGCNKEPGSAGSADERNDGEGECTKLNGHLIDRFRRLIAEGMNIRILGRDNADLLKPDADV